MHAFPCISPRCRLSPGSRSSLVAARQVFRIPRLEEEPGRFVGQDLTVRRKSVTIMGRPKYPAFEKVERQRLGPRRRNHHIGRVPEYRPHVLAVAQK